MQMRPEIQIATMITAMTDVIMPAIDPKNRLANEQSQLVVGMLHLMEKQLPLQFRFDRDELQRLIKAAGDIDTICGEESARSEALKSLSDARAAATETLEKCQVEPASIVEFIRALRSGIGLVLTDIGERGTVGHLEATEAVVLKMSREQFLRDRALLVPQNWETDPASLPSIETLLSTV
ncbi:hypothetical protein BG58_27865 [Caballeronia jiangsuensis]|nr:hypothetical protein BG58_27865 [Caballeronia jiangsuensis]